MYTIKLTVMNVVSKRSIATSVQVFVQKGSIVAAVAEGSELSVRLNDKVRWALRGTATYDTDMPVASRAAAASLLSYQWTCLQIKPTFADSCAFVGVDSWKNSVLSGYLPADASTSSVYKLTMVASSGDRSSQADIVISVRPSIAPIVSVQSTVARINPVDKLKIVGSVANINLYGVNCSWSIDDTSLDLASIAVTTTSSYFAPASSSASYIGYMNLALAPNSLYDRSTFTFILTSRTTTGVESRASVTVTTNGPPLPGTFDVQPHVGVELTTSFMFLASKWSDEDLPLTYAFSFTSSTGALLTLQSRSEISYGNSTLPAGDPDKGYSLGCVVKVYDSVSACSTASSTVIVNQTKLRYFYFDNY